MFHSFDLVILQPTQVKFHTFAAGIHIYPPVTGQKESDANYWAIHTLFITLTTLCLKESAPA